MAKSGTLYTPRYIVIWNKQPLFTSTSTKYLLQRIEDYVRGCTHDSWQKLRLFAGFINKYLVDETAALNVSTEPLKTIDCDSRF